MGVNKECWNGRKVLLTGHTGFKGGWLAVWLQMLGARVYGLALEPATAPSLWQAARLDAQVNGDYVDLRDQAAVVDTVRRVDPDVVFHLAAQPLVRASYRDPVETYATNVMGTVHLLEALRSSQQLKAIVVVTTDKCYENREWLWPYREQDRLGGIDPYSNSKACVELVCNSYRQSFLAANGVQLATARAGNVIGGGDWAEERLLPDVLRAWDAGQELVLRYPQATRPWQHVLEPLCGYLLLAQRLLSKPDDTIDAWNFGPDAAGVVSVGELVERLARLWRTGQVSWRVAEQAQPHEASLLALDSSRAGQLLGWRNRWDVETALQRTLEWHWGWQEGADLVELCRQQIRSYERALP